MFGEAASEGRSLIFTFAPEKSVPTTFVDEVRAAIEPHGGRIRFVALACDDAVREGRIEDPSRARWGKLNSLALARSLGADNAHAFPPLPAELTVDTGRLSPEAAAAKIQTALGLPSPLAGGGVAKGDG